MKKILISLSLLLAFNILYAQDIKVTQDWQLLGATEDLNTSSFDKKCVDFIWKYDNGWKVYIVNGKNYNLPSGITKFGTINKGEGFWIKGSKNCDINVTDDVNIKALFAGKTFYTYQYDQWGIWRSEYNFDNNGTLSVVDCQGHNKNWQNCETPNIMNWSIEDNILKLSQNTTDCTFNAEEYYINSDDDKLIMNIKNITDSCDPKDAAEHNNKKEIYYKLSMTPFKALKNMIIGKKLNNGKETYYFRENDIIVGDTGSDPTKIASYGGLEDNKLKVLYSGDETGEYDLISQTSNGFLIEFFEKVNGTIQANGSETTTNQLEDFTQTELDNVLLDK